MGTFGYFKTLARHADKRFRSMNQQGFIGRSSRNADKLSGSLAFRVNAILDTGNLLLFAGMLLWSCGGSESEVTPVPEEKALSALSIFPDQLVASVGDGIYLETGDYLKVTALDLAGHETTDVTYTLSSSSPDIVRIEGDGRIQAIAVGTAIITVEAGGQSAQVMFHVGELLYDVATLGPPRILDADYIDLSKINRISRFRSTVGHSYVDGSGETCRSMKHYYEPYYPEVDWTTVDIYAPTTGNVYAAPDGAYGYAILLRPKAVSSMFIQIFHVNLDPGFVNGAWVNVGDHLGKQASNNTSSDISMYIGGKDNGILLSYFDCMTDPVFEAYQARGLVSRADAIISKAERDADPVPCEGENQFTEHGSIPDWVILN